MSDIPLDQVADDDTTEEPSRARRRFRLSVPTAFTILFILTILAVVATRFVPAGSYAKLAYDAGTSQLSVTSPTGEVKTYPATQDTLDSLNVKIGVDKFTSGALNKPVSVPGTYQRLEQHPMGVADITRAMTQGTVEAADVIVFILVLGGLIGVVRKTGAFESGLMAMTKKTKGREFLLVLTVSLLMVLGGTTCGLEEEAVAFYPILVPIFIAMGYDSIVCVGAIFLAGSVGTTFSTINPFSSVIASNAAGIQFTEGISWRVAGCIAGAIAVSVYMWWYSNRVKRNPELSYSREDHEAFMRKWSMTSTVAPAFTWRRKVILVLFAAAFPIMVWGVMSQGWWFPTMAASFLAIAIIIMVLAATGRERLGEVELVDAFSEGSASLVAVSLIIGLARGINLVLNEGMISDTLLHSATQMVQGMNGPAFIVMMMVVFFILGFFVPSSSGLAVLSMPIMAPLADTVGIQRSVVVCAYQWGQYAMLYLAPTGLVMATLQMLGMKYSHWLRFVWPMVAFVGVFGAGMLVTQVLVT